MSHLLADTDWRPALGDPHAFAWVIVAVYLLASWFCLAAGRSQSIGSHGRIDLWFRRFWMVLAVLMLGLALNKQLDFQTLFTQLGRAIAKRRGWYAERRSIQTVFVLGCAVVGIVGLIASGYFLRSRWRRCGLAYLGVVMLGAFITVRAASFHHVNVMKYDVSQTPIWTIAGLELGGALMVAVGAFSSRSTRTATEP
jgi:hypothetical protein